MRCQGRRYPATSARAGRAPDPRRERGQKDNQSTTGKPRQGKDDEAFSKADRVVKLDTFYPRCTLRRWRLRIVADVNPATGPRHAVDDLAGARTPPHAVRDRRRSTRAKHPDHLARHSEAVRPQVPIYPVRRRTAASLLIGKP